MEIQDLIEEQIQKDIEKLGGESVQSEEYKTLVDGITKLTDRAIELKKYEAACANDYQKVCQAAEEAKDRKIKNGIAIASIVVPTIVTIWGTLKSFKFEETGTVTTILGRGFINKLLPKK